MLTDQAVYALVAALHDVAAALREHAAAIRGARDPDGTRRMAERIGEDPTTDHRDRAVPSAH